MKTASVWLVVWGVCGQVAVGGTDTPRPHIARDGSPGMVVVCGADPIPAERTAVRELVEHVAKVSGATLKTVAEKDVPNGAPAIYVGHTAFAAEQGVKVDALGPDRWVIRTVGNRLILSGGRPRGTLYAVYEFLETHLGCHWLDEQTSVIPRRPTLPLPQVDATAQPAFASRGIYTLVRGVTMTPEKFLAECVLTARNKSNGHATYLPPEYGHPERAGSPGDCHTFHGYLAPKDYFAKHPEYFSMSAGGVRQKAHGQLCLTNPDVRRIVLEKLKGFIAKDRRIAATDGRPLPRVYEISQNDYHHMCHCPTCQAIARREGSDSGPLLDFINEFLDRLKRWSQLAKHLSIWDYWITYGDEFTSPYVNVRCIGPDLRVLKQMGAMTIFVENENPERQSFFALKRWLGFKMMDNPDRPAGPLIQVFMDGYYGRGASHMLAYLNDIERRIAADPDKLVTVSPYLRKYLDLDLFVTANGLLDKAEAACASDAASLLHVRRERIPVDEAVLFLWNTLARRAGGADRLPFDRDKVLGRYEAYRLEQMQAFRSAKMLPAGRRGLARDMARLRLKPIPLPEQFRTMPRQDIVTLDWPDFPAKGKRVAIVPDPDAAGGMAARYLGEPGHHRRPAAFGVYNGRRRVFGPSVTLKDPPQDQKYHWYKIGRFPVENGVLVWAHWTWWITVNLNRAHNPAATDNTYDVWISLKLVGPAYVKGATGPDAVMVDRVILVKAKPAKAR